MALCILALQIRRPAESLHEALLQSAFPNGASAVQRRKSPILVICPNPNPTIPEG